MRAAGLLMIVLCGAVDARAQDARIPAFAADVRGGMARFKADAGVAVASGVGQANVPTHGFSLAGDAHWYALRLRKITIGVGAEMVIGRGSRTLEAATASAPTGPTVRTHFSELSPQLSFNFGKRNGWSYISAGLGRATFYLDRADQALVDTPDRTKSLNYGGGARWFTRKHVAFSFDLRWYALSPQPATATRPAFPRTKNMVISAGLGFRL